MAIYLIAINNNVDYGKPTERETTDRITGWMLVDVTIGTKETRKKPNVQGSPRGWPGGAMTLPRFFPNFCTLWYNFICIFKMIK